MKPSGRSPHGWQGWDEYAAFYDWENARTFGRRDVAFWKTIARQAVPPVLELGCGTGRVLVPIARAGVPVVGIDRSAPMLERARVRARRLERGRRPAIVRGDIRTLPYAANTFGAVIAAYGLLQSLLHDRDLDALVAEVARVLKRGGTFGIDLVPDLPAWKEYRQQVRLRGRSERGTHVTLVETVRQDRRRGLTIFDEEFIERRGRRKLVRVFSLTFRTVSVQQIAARLSAAGFRVEAVLGDYRGRAWTPDAEAWVILAKKLIRKP
ncbi:MAG: class I SAM-dependent methyltransferase [Acidobacteria bacterium]|nr:class I SAM-dependent methyltransferase [Acidobacteriota bacterium]